MAKINEAAGRQGRTLYSYVSEIFEQSIRAYEMNRSLGDIIDDYEILEVHKEAGTALTPPDLLDYLVAKVYAKNSRNLLQLSYNAGRWYGIYLKERFDDSFKAFMRLLQSGRWDLSEVSTKQNKETIELKCVSAFLSQERTLLIRNFLEGALSSLGYEVKAHDCFKGIIRLRFSPQTVD